MGLGPETIRSSCAFPIGLLRVPNQTGVVDILAREAEVGGSRW